MRNPIYIEKVKWTSEDQRNYNRETKNGRLKDYDFLPSSDGMRLIDKRATYLKEQEGFEKNRDPTYDPRSDSYT